MKKLRIEAEEGKEQRLDAFLAEKLPQMSRSAVQKLIEDGCVIKNGLVLRKNYKVQNGEAFEVSLPDVKETELEAEDIPLEIIYEDADVIVINKPKGMVVHPAAGHEAGTLVNALLHHCGDSLSGIGGEKRPGIVHRIDKDTSGLIIAAKNDKAHNSLSSQLKDRSLSRVYDAIVIGNIKTDSGTIDAPIGRHPTDRKKMAVTAKNSRNAITHYEVVSRYDGFTHMRCHLETGRTHQIRVHMASIGHPVYGDTVYGRKKPEKDIEGQCLHASRIKFVHPTTGEYVELGCPLPEYFAQILRKLDKRT